MTPEKSKFAYTPSMVLNLHEVNAAFENTNFGPVDRRKMIGQGLLSLACGRACGHTLTGILHKLGLTTAKGNLTKKGKAQLLESFYDRKHSG